MGKFGQTLNMAGSVIGGGIIGGAGKAVGGLFGAIGAGARQRKLLQAQEQAQMRLNEQAAKLNFTYGEAAANNAFERQMKMYERSYKDQSYAAMRNQMEEAGLSVGLMYGGAGAGGAGGATSGAPMGATGGAEAGNAGSTIAAAVEQELGLQRMGLEVASLKQDIENKEKTGENIDANTDNLKEEAALKKSQRQTEDESRDVKIEKIRQEGKFTWIQNLHSKWLDEHDGSVIENPGVDLYNNDIFGSHGIVNNSIWAGMNSQNLYKLLTDIGKVERENDLLEIEKVIKGEEAKHTFALLMSAITKNNAEAAKAYAEELATKHSIGEHVNWKTFVDYGVMGVEALTRIVVGREAAKAVRSTLNQGPLRDITTETKTITSGKKVTNIDTRRETTKGVRD